MRSLLLRWALAGAVLGAAAPTLPADDGAAGPGGEPILLKWAERDMDEGRPSDYLVVNALQCSPGRCELSSIRVSACVAGAFYLYPTVLNDGAGGFRVRRLSDHRLRVEYDSYGVNVVYTIDYRRSERPLMPVVVVGVTGVKAILGRAVTVQPILGTPGTTGAVVDLPCRRLAVPTVEGSPVTTGGPPG